METIKFKKVIDPIEIIDELKEYIVSSREKQAQLIEDVRESRLEIYEKEEMKRLKESYDSMRREMSLGFPITEKEHDKIEAWKKDWFKRKRGGDEYMGAIGSGFTYSFMPTGIGTIGEIIAPDGEKFKFQDL